MPIDAASRSKPAEKSPDSSIASSAAGAELGQSPGPQRRSSVHGARRCASPSAEIASNRRRRRSSPRPLSIRVDLARRPVPERASWAGPDRNGNGRGRAARPGPRTSLRTRRRRSRPGRPRPSRLAIAVMGAVSGGAADLVERAANRRRMRQVELGIARPRRRRVGDAQRLMRRHQRLKRVPDAPTSDLRHRLVDLHRNADQHSAFAAEQS